MQRFSVTFTHLTSPGVVWQPNQPAANSSGFLGRMEATSNPGEPTNGYPKHPSHPAALKRRAADGIAG